MTETSPLPSSSAAAKSVPRTELWWCIVGLALFLIAHNFCLSLLPTVGIPISPEEMTPTAGGLAYSVPFDFSPGGNKLNPRSRVTLTEDGREQKLKMHEAIFVVNEGGSSWSHLPGRIIFSTADGTDPRTNGRRYVVHTPVLYSRTVGYGAIMALIGAGLMLRQTARRMENKGEAMAVKAEVETTAQRDATRAPMPLRTPMSRAMKWHLGLGVVVFLGGLYCATGSLAPYAATMMPRPDPATGYLYNIDHEVHRTIVSFVDGQPRATWQDSLLLRRIVYPVLAWPFMKTMGYETGGVIFNLLFNTLGFVAGVLMVRRHVGERGARLAVWLLAVYPGAAYWAGQPYSYAVIFPLSIAAFWLLLELPAARGARLVGLSLGMGVIFLSYDFHAYFLPATVLLLVWHRRFGAAVGAAVLQVAPLAAWLWVLKNVVKLPLENSNTTVYGKLIEAFFDPAKLTANLQRLAGLPEVAADIFFGANFLFLPLLAVAAWGLDFRWRDFVRQRACVVLLAAGMALFVFCNVPPPHDGPWNLSGSWISRLYQPLFPALVVYIAWWWQELQPSGRVARGCRLGVVAAVIAGNALICFGPISGLSLGVAKTAWYRFYNHTDLHWVYERNLRMLGRRPIGFPQPIVVQPPP